MTLILYCETVHVFILIFRCISGKTETQAIRELMRDYKINITFEETIQSQPQPKPNTSNTMNDLLAKHSRVGIGETPSCLEEELSRFMHVRSNDDVLIFWKKNDKIFPRLALVARAILAIPITSTASEGAFSEAGCLIRSRRASIAPHRVEKVLFVHDNYNLFKL